MQKEYGDAVIYVRNGVAINALVLVSTIQTFMKPGVPTEFEKENGLHVAPVKVVEEHLSMSYLDPLFAKGALSSTDMDRAVARVINIGPVPEGGTNGWKEVPFYSEPGSGIVGSSDLLTTRASDIPSDFAADTAKRRYDEFKAKQAEAAKSTEDDQAKLVAQATGPMDGEAAAVVAAQQSAADLVAAETVAQEATSGDTQLP